jgi:tight adherence protein B
MSLDHRTMVLGAAALGLLVVCGGAVALLLYAEKSKKIAERMALVMPQKTKASAAPAPRPRVVRKAAPRQRGLLQYAETIFGCTPPCREASALQWWIVLPVALFCARLVVELPKALIGPWGIVLIVPIWIWISRKWWAKAEYDRRNLLYRQFPDSLAMIVRSVRVGIPVSEGIRAAAREQPAPTSEVLGSLSDQLAVGIPLDEALRAMAEKCGVAEYRFFATALTLQAQTGGGLAETLDNLGDVIRKRLALKSRAVALSGEAKMSSAILGSLPILAAMALAVMNPKYISVLLLDPSGNKVLAVALGMLGAGVVTMRSLIRKALA